MHADCYPPGQNGQSGTLSQHVAGQTGTVSLDLSRLSQVSDGNPSPVSDEIAHAPPAGSNKTDRRLDFQAPPWGGGKMFSTGLGA